MEQRTKTYVKNHNDVLNDLMHLSKHKEIQDLYIRQAMPIRSAPFAIQVADMVIIMTLGSRYQIQFEDCAKPFNLIKNMVLNMMSGAGKSSVMQRARTIINKVEDKFGVWLQEHELLEIGCESNKEWETQALSLIVDTESEVPQVASAPPKKKRKILHQM